MSNILNQKSQKPSIILSNIKLLKIIAIILGLLIIIGSFFLFLGISNSLNKLNNDKKNVIQNIQDDSENFTNFDFNQPLDAQLISSSIGQKNQILLRYLYKGKNTLVVLDISTKKIRSIITLRKGKENFKIN